MKELKISVIQLRSSVGKVAENIARASILIGVAAEAKPDIILLPELFSVGPFTYENRFEWPSFGETSHESTLEQFRRKAMENSVAVAVPMWERDSKGWLFDSVFLIDCKGDVIGSYRKTHLRRDASLDVLYFKPGSRLHVLRFKDWHIGFLFGNELLHPEATRVLSVLGAEVLLIPSACRPRPLWAEMHRSRAFENGCYLVVANLCSGNEESTSFCGGSLFVDPFGEIIDRLGEREQAVLTKTISMLEVNRARNIRFMLRDRRPEIYGLLTKDAAWLNAD